MPNARVDQLALEAFELDTAKARVDQLALETFALDAINARVGQLALEAFVLLPVPPAPPGPTASAQASVGASNTMALGSIQTLAAFGHASTVQVTGGNFQEPSGKPLTAGFLILTLSRDGQYSTTKLTRGIRVKLPLDNTGNVAHGPFFLVPNDLITPAGTFYSVQVCRSDGTVVSNPNLTLTVLSSINPFDLGVNWTPNV